MAGNNHKITIEKLTPDYTDSLGASASTGPISPAGNEAPMMLHRGSWYYLFFGPTCCFCHQGSGAEVWAATHPMGPWTSTGLDLNPEHGFPAKRVIAAQESFVVEYTSSGGLGYLYVGDRWTSASDHLKSHDFQFWHPLEFNDTLTPPVPSPLQWVDNFTIDVR